MNIYNTRALSQNQRFWKAVAFGIPTAIGCAIVLGIAQKFMFIQFQIFYLAVGYAVAYVVRTFGRGVQPKFAILAAGLTAASLLLADALSIGGFAGLFQPVVWMYVVSTWVSVQSVFAIMGLLFRYGAIYLAYEQGRFL